MSGAKRSGRGGWVEVDGVSRLFRPQLFGMEDEGEEDEDDGGGDRDRDEEEEVHEPRGPEGTWALKDVSFSVEPGELFAVLGSPGGGKTTLLKIIGGIQLPTAGEVRGGGLRIDLAAIRAPVSKMFTMRKNLLVMTRLLGVPDERLLDRLDEIAAYADVEAAMGHKVSRLPRSLFGRAATVAALMLEPDTILIDDPLIIRADRSARDSIWSLLDRAIEAGATVITSSNGVAPVLERCSRAIWLDEGKIVKEDSAATLIPVHRYVDQQARGGKLPCRETILRMVVDGTTDLEIATDPGDPPQDIQAVPPEDLHRTVRNLWAAWEMALDQTRETRAAAPQANVVCCSERWSDGEVRAIDAHIEDEAGEMVSTALPGERLTLVAALTCGLDESTLLLRVGLHVEGAKAHGEMMPPIVVGPMAAGRWTLRLPIQGGMTDGLRTDVSVTVALDACPVRAGRIVPAASRRLEVYVVIRGSAFSGFLKTHGIVGSSANNSVFCAVTPQLSWTGSLGGDGHEQDGTP